MSRFRRRCLSPGWVIVSTTRCRLGPGCIRRQGFIVSATRCRVSTAAAQPPCWMQMYPTSGVQAHRVGDTTPPGPGCIQRQGFIVSATRCRVSTAAAQPPCWMHVYPTSGSPCGRYDAAWAHAVSTARASSCRRHGARRSVVAVPPLRALSNVKASGVTVSSTRCRLGSAVSTARASSCRRHGASPREGSTACIYRGVLDPSGIVSATRCTHPRRAAAARRAPEELRGTEPRGCRPCRPCRLGCRGAAGRVSAPGPRRRPAPQPRRCGGCWARPRSAHAAKTPRA